VSSEQFRAQDCLADIVDNIEPIERHVVDLDRDRLATDGLRRDAVERCLERICEAAFRLGDRAEALMPGQSWGAIRGLGNRLRHAYDRIDFTVIWGVITERLPALKAAATTALAKLQGESGSST
jgi:uncharacterized protein with HEPN domain